MKKIFFITFALLTGIVLALVYGELFLRLNPEFGYNRAAFRFERKKMVNLRDFNLGYLRPSELLGYEMIPNKAAGLQTPSNSYGLIGKEYRLRKDRNIFRILLLGDSIAVMDHSRQFLEGKLNNNPALNSRYNFEIWNAGVPSYDVRRYYLYLKHKGLNYDPDLLLIFIYMNDFDLNLNIYYRNEKGFSEYYFPITEVLKKYRVNNFLMINSYLYRFIVLKFNSRLLADNENPGCDVLRDDGMNYLGKIKDICRERKITLLAVIFPYLKDFSEYNDYELRRYKTICAVINELNIENVNLLNLYYKLLNSGLDIRDKKDDAAHPNKQTHKLIADDIYSYILANNFKNNIFQ